MSIYESCTPRKEVLEGELEDAIFAADFGQLVQGRAPAVYDNPQRFFENTYPTQQLRELVRLVFEHLANPKESGMLVRLSTGFGGGKTHALMALWHLARNIHHPQLGAELLPPESRPTQQIHVVAIDASKAGVPDFAIHDNITVHSLWGELFYQLAGAEGVNRLGKSDAPDASPPEELLVKILPQCPILILLDELVIYMSRLERTAENNLLAFLNSLMSVISSRPQAVLVLTDPREQPVYSKESERLAQCIAHFDQICGRRTSNFDPIGDESSQIIVRRLFEKTDPTAANNTAQAYFQLFQRVRKEFPDVLASSVATAEYRQRIATCYPFHPRLIDSAQKRLSALSDFQKSRGVLRLFARIVRDVWHRREPIELISAGDINWSNPEIQADLLDRINRGDFRAAIRADVEMHAAELDGKQRGIHTRVASAILLDSLPNDPQSGLDNPDITLAVLRLDEAGREPTEAADRLAGVCWHLHPRNLGGYRFRYEANVLKQIEELCGTISAEDARARARAEIQNYFASGMGRLVAWPQSPRQVPDTTEFLVVLCENEELARTITTSVDDGTDSHMPRRFINTLVAIAPDPAAWEEAEMRARRVLAAEKLEQDTAEGEAGKFVRDQLIKKKPQLEREFRLQARRAFHRVVIAGVSYSMEERFRGSDEEVLKSPCGQKLLRDFLVEKKLLYTPDDVLDLDLFMNHIVKGATPVDHDVTTTLAIKERFASAQQLRLLCDTSIVTKTIVEAVRQGRIVVRFASGDTFDNAGAVTGPPGQRRRNSHHFLQTCQLSETILVSPSDSPRAREWTATDAPQPASPTSYAPSPPPPPPPDSLEIDDDPKQMAETNKTRPLRKLVFHASAPETTRKYEEICRAFCAKRVLVEEALVHGKLKGGGNAQLAIENTEINHSIKPLNAVDTLYRALKEDEREYSVKLALDFGEEGKWGLEEQLASLEQVSRSSTERIIAHFGKTRGSAS